MKTMLFIALAFTVISALAAEDFELVYLHGEADYRTTEGWVAAEIGSRIPGESTIRLRPGSLAELVSQSATPLLSKPGLYRLDQSVARSSRVEASPTASLFRRIGRLRSGGENRQSAVMGVRGSEADEDFALEWVEEGNLSYDAALNAYQRGDHALAVTILEEEIEPSGLEDQTAYWYLLAAAYTEAGRKGEALRVVNRNRGDEESSSYRDYLLLRGRLFLESLNAEAAQREYERYLHTVSSDDERQLGYYLRGFALLQQRQRREGLRDLRRAVVLAADPEVTRAAKALLQD